MVEHTESMYDLKVSVDRIEFVLKPYGLISTESSDDVCVKCSLSVKNEIGVKTTEITGVLRSGELRAIADLIDKTI